VTITSLLQRWQQRQHSLETMLKRLKGPTAELTEI